MVVYHGRKKEGVSIVQSDMKEMSVFTRHRSVLGTQLAGTIEITNESVTHGLPRRQRRYLKYIL